LTARRARLKTQADKGPSVSSPSASLEQGFDGAAFGIDDLDRLARPVVAEAGDGLDDHSGLIGVREQEVTGRRPCTGTGVLKVTRGVGPQLPRRAAHHVVDAVDDGVLEVVLVPTEHEPDAGLLEQRNHRSTIPVVFPCSGPAQNGGWWEKGMRQRARDPSSARLTHRMCAGSSK
jgi:hypothetical protein